MEALVLLVALGCVLQAQGRIVAKCELRDQLRAAVGNVTWPGRSGTDDLVARLVCLAETGAGFDTAALQELAAGQLDAERRGEGGGRQRKDGPRLWMLYGIFQLSNGLSCSDSVNASHDICGLSCSKLLDDDVSDDISCLLTFFRNLANNGSSPPPPFDVMRRVQLLFRKRCRDVDPTDYLAACPAP